MISPELLRRYPFFAGISPENVVEIAKIGKEITAEAGEYFFREGEQLESFYLLLEGEVAILLEVPDREAKNPVSEQLAGEITTKDVVVSTVAVGGPFGWAAITPPPKTYLAAKATQPCKLVAFNAAALRTMFAADPAFGYQMALRVAEKLREQLRDLSIETLACIV